MSGLFPTRRVPLAWRNLTADRRRLGASVVAVGLAVMLMLVLDGMWNGLLAETHLYTDHAGADLYVLQPGLGELGTGVLPMSSVDAVRRTRGVAWASPVQDTSVMFDVRGATAAAEVIGTPPGAHGGAWSIAAGRAVRTDNEIVVDKALAGSHGLHVGDTLTVLARPFRIVGLSAGTSGFMAAYMFVTHAASEALLGAPGTTSYVLVGARDPTAVRSRLSAAGFNVRTAAQIAASQEKLQSDLFAGPVLLMVAVAFGGGTLVIALTAYTTVVERRREYGIVKALGARRGRLVTLAVSQTIGLALLGLVAGGVLFLVGQQAIIRARPDFDVAFTAGAAARATAAAVGMAVVAAIIPARRLAALEPASAFRGS